jgi:predicted DNA-binding transcriptional regulator YafY
VAPYGAGTKNGFWYLAGLDLDKTEVRVFRLDRFDSPVSAVGKGNSFEIPSDFSMSEVLASPERVHTATLALRRNRAHALRVSAIEIEDADDWTVVTYPYFNESQLIEDVLWHLDDVKVLEPQSAVNEIKRKLMTLVEDHG